MIRLLPGDHLRAGIASLLFPASCPACGNPLEDARRAPLCPACRAKLPLIEPPVWQSAPFAFDQAISACRHESPIKELIAAFKYTEQLSAGPFLGELLAETVRRRLGENPADAIVPVPLHPVRFRQRTFNQAAVLAKELSERLSLPLWYRSLVRTQPAPPQAALSGKERRSNVRSAFSVEELPRADARILLVDDVLTTGSTADACARALNRAGASRVTVVTLSRQEIG